MVGELTDAGGPQERGIIGQTPNLAARLQSSAEPNQVIIAESTRRLLGNLFELKHLGARGLKGIAEPVQTWAVLRVSSVASRFEALHHGRPDGPSSGGKKKSNCFYGAGPPQKLVKVKWCCSRARRASANRGLRLNSRNASPVSHLPPLRYFCSPQHTDSALYPIIGQMERAAGIRLQRHSANEARQARRPC